MTEAARPQSLAADDAVLVLVDHLSGFLPGLRTIEPARYRANVEAFAALGEIFVLPTLVLGDEGSFRGTFLPPVKERLGRLGWPNFPRHTPSGWRAPGFAEAVAATGRRTLVMGGISLDNCLMLTALDALAAGYRVWIVADCSGTDDRLVETAALLRLAGAGAVTTGWVGLAAELMGDWRSSQGEAVGALYKRHSSWGQAAP